MSFSGFHDLGAANKYPGFCVVCNQKVGAGHGELTRSASGAWVVRCSGSSKTTRSSASRATSTTPKSPRKAGTCKADEGIVVLNSPRLGERDASRLVGEVFRAGKRAGAVADQVVYVVGAETWYQSDADNEDMGDMGGGGWGATRYVRLATVEEAASLVAREEATRSRKARADRVNEIARLIMERGRVPEEEAERYEVPEDAWIWNPRSGTTGGVLVVDGDRVISWDSGFYDDYRRSMGVVEDAALAAEIRELRTAMGSSMGGFGWRRR